MWYAEKVAEQINSGTLPTDVKTNVGKQIIREVSAKWITKFFHFVCCNKDLVINGFKKAGIVYAISEDSLVWSQWKLKNHSSQTLILKF